MTSVISAVSASGTVRVLILSANPQLRERLCSRLEAPHWLLNLAISGADALEQLEDADTELLLLDPSLPDLDPGEFRELVQARFPYVQVLTLNTHTGQPLPSAASTPLSTRIVAMLERAPVLDRTAASSLGVTEAESSPEAGLPGMVGKSDAMRRVYALVQMVSRRDTTVLIAGESGTGKDLVARAIHLLSPRRSSPFVVINCAAIPEALLEAELFGYAKGAFTGALQSRMGRIHAAQGGTLFLDEIGDMPIGLQSKMLRFLEQGEVQRLGSTDNFRVDVRVVAATNSDLKKAVQEQRFREDLYYRLAVFPLHLPPLREHAADLPALANTFLGKYGSRRISITAEAMSFLGQHTWPGNVRELRNVIERACILVGDELEVTPEHIVI